jgi:hypothetical protein
VQPLITRQGKTVLARWKTPPEVRSLVLFDGAVEAGPGYTEALERIFQHIDRERGARIERNRYWGHVSLETSQFLVDVATSGYHALQAARPRPLQGVDIITGVIHPTIRHGECALILKDYVGPYAGGKGDWAVMASSALEEMTVPDGNTLRIRFRGVARVTHIGEQAIAVRDAAEFEAVENPLRVWERLWQAKKAFHIAEIPGGTEMVVTSEAPVEIRVVGK